MTLRSSLHMQVLTTIERESPDKPSAPRLDAWVALLITLAVFSLVLATPFSVVDDWRMLRDNQSFVQPSIEGFRTQLTTPQHNIYAPLTFGLWYTVAAVTSNGESLPATGFKLVSWLAHGMATFAAWWVVWLIVRHRAGAMIGALVVGLHPLQVESVAWTTGTKDVLCGAFSFGAIALYVQAIKGARRRHLRWAIVFGILAIAAKPTGVVLPAILIAVDFAIRRVSIQKRLADLWPFLPASGIGALIILNVQHATAIESAPIALRPLIVLDSYGFYLLKTILPFNLTVDYARTPEWVRSTGQLIWTWIIPITAAVIVLASRSRLALLATVIFVVPILPVSGLVSFDMQQYSTVTDHYAYQSLLGVGLVAAMVARRFAQSKYVLAAGISILAVLSVWQLRLWLDPLTLYEHGVQVAPRSLMSRGALVSLAMDRNAPAEAERWAREAINIKPRADAYVNLTIALVLQRRPIEAAEIAKQALRHDSLTFTAENMRYWIQLAREVVDTELAKAAAALWTRIEPANPAPRRLLEQIEAARSRDPSTRPAAGD